MADKFPFLQLYVTDWRTDPCLSMCGPATRGIWIDLVCAMWEMDRSGKLTGTPAALARVARCSADEMLAALCELHDTATADVTPRPESVTVNVTVTNRRMSKDWHERKSAAVRKDRQREREASREQNGGGHAEVTVESRDIFQRSEVREEINLADRGSAKRVKPGVVEALLPVEKSTEFDLESLYALYPRKEGKSKGLKLARSQVRTQADFNALKRAITRYATSVRGKDREYVKHFSTFMGCWRDYLDAEPVVAVADPDDDPIMAELERRQREWDEQGVS